MKAWHFLKQDGRTGEGNLLVVEGETMRVTPPVKLCERGLHFSVRALDALQYAPGPVVQYVEVPDDAVMGNDKGVAEWRKCLWMYDATNILHEFACQCAESALMIADVDDARSWNAIHVKREWLAGRASDADLAAARDTARAAARDAAWDTARDAARDAAWDTASAAAWAAARDAAWDTASAAAWAAARDAARDAARAAARDAARDAARAAAWAEMSANLEWMLLKAR